MTLIENLFKRKRNKLAKRLAENRGCDFPSVYYAMATAMLLDEPTIMNKDGEYMYDPISPVNRK